MVDEILIDPAYDGRLFCPTIVDAPLRRRTLVSGVYTLDRHATGALLAVKIIDVTGGEAWMVMPTDGETLTF
jgi:site-specific DNA-methyltransferase (adenine-specific)